MSSTSVVMGPIDTVSGGGGASGEGEGSDADGNVGGSGGVSSSPSNPSSESSDANDPFAKMTNAELGKSIPQSQKVLLRQWFGNNLSKAEEAETHFNPPQGLTQDTLEKYEEIAKRAIAAGNDTQGVQAVRLRLVERALS